MVAASSGTELHYGRGCMAHLTKELSSDSLLLGTSIEHTGKVERCYSRQWWWGFAVPRI